MKIFSTFAVAAVVAISVLSAIVYCVIKGQRVAAVTATSVLSAAEVINLTDKNVWNVVRNTKFAENQMTPPGRFMYKSKKLFAIDPSKKYTLNLEITGGEGTKPAQVLCGFLPASDKGKLYAAVNLQTHNDSFTQIAEDAKKGDTVIKVKNASKWKKSNIYVIAYNAAEDFSDLPNYSLIKSNVKSLKKEGDVWTVTLNKPISVDLAAGTNVRQHIYGGYYFLNGPSCMIAPGKTVKYTNTITGKANYGTYNRNAFHPAVKNAYFIILADWNYSKTPVTIKNATLTIE